MKPRWKLNQPPHAPAITAGYVIAMVCCFAVMFGLIWRGGK